MTHITDRRHLAQRIQDGIAALLELQDHWLDEDRNACTPTSSDGTPTSTGPSDPTGNLTRKPNRYQDRDHLGTAIATRIDALTKLANSRQPRTPTRRCRCCGNDMATHGNDHNGQPTDCHACWRYLRTHDHRCDQAVHDTRPTIRWCECPPACCDPCPDHAAEGRQLSDRCRQRKTRGHWERDTA